MYWILAIICCTNTVIGYFFLKETYAPVLLRRRKSELQAQDKRAKYHFDGEDTRPIRRKILGSLKRPIVIFIQPIVLTMSFYQALIFGTTYSIYTNMQEIYSNEPYNFDTEQVGLLYLGPGLGFLVSVWFLVPRIDTVYNRLTERNKGHALPEYRLPLANIGAYRPTHHHSYCTNTRSPPRQHPHPRLPLRLRLDGASAALVAHHHRRDFLLRHRPGRHP